MLDEMSHAIVKALRRTMLPCVELQELKVVSLQGSRRT
jgi:hypothetical protein